MAKTVTLISKYPSKVGEHHLSDARLHQLDGGVFTAGTANTCASLANCPWLMFEHQHPPHPGLLKSPRYIYINTTFRYRSPGGWKPGARKPEPNELHHCMSWWKMQTKGVFESGCVSQNGEICLNKRFLFEISLLRFECF